MGHCSHSAKWVLQACPTISALYRGSFISGSLLCGPSISTEAPLIKGDTAEAQVGSDVKATPWIQARKWSHLRDTFTLPLGRQSYEHGKVLLHSSVLLAFQSADPNLRCHAHTWPVFWIRSMSTVGDNRFKKARRSLTMCNFRNSMANLAV